MQLFLAEELVGMGASKSGADQLTLNGISYSRGTSFSQKVQAAAEKICREYLQQNINCFLVKDGPIITLWISKTGKEASNVKQKPQSSPQVKPEQQTSSSQLQSQPVPPETERTMTYRGKTYKVNTNEQSSPEVPSEMKTQPPQKKRMYRGRAY